MEHAAGNESEENVSEENVGVESSEGELATASWVSCAKEGGTCEFSGLMEVRYGAKDRFVTKVFRDGVRCSNSSFGDPIPNTPKACSMRKPKGRDPWLWPFAQTSIWNMPIGSGAKRVAANLPGTRNNLGVDEEHFIRARSSDPQRPVFAGNDWTHRCKNPPTRNPQHLNGLKVAFPDDFVLNRSKSGYTPNECAAVLLADGKSLIQFEPLTRCEKGGPVYGWTVTGESLYGPGIRGTHFGSGLSAIGGSIRKGELIGNAPIRHALKLVMWARYLHFDPKTKKGYRWPATNHDGYASPTTYTGSLPALQMGSLLALPTSATPAALGVQTPAGKKIFAALQDFGAYVVDDSAWDSMSFAGEVGVSQELANAYGYGMTGKPNNPFVRDVDAMIKALQVITNNSENAVGGGGTPRASLAPPFVGQ
jgi:hypothetical protein